MFKNREFRVRVAKIDDGLTPPLTVREKPIISREEVIPLTKDLMKLTAVCVVGVIAVKAFTNAASEIAIQRFGNPN